MKIKLIAVGTKMPKWVELGFENYIKRLPKDFSLELIEIPVAKRSKNQLVEKWKEEEGKQVLKNIKANDYVVALEVKGKNWSTEQLSDELIKWKDNASNVALMVGGPDGLSTECIQRSNQQWSLSSLTMPHPIVRVVIAEAIYRAWSVTVNHPYHRE
jgi:23S rRNA (pseudouridine1915-N3)-methyltransferase